MENTKRTFEIPTRKRIWDGETRTLSAKQAVLKARKIVERNEELVAVLKAGFDNDFKIPSHVFESHDFDLGEIVDENYKIKTASKFKNFFREMLRSIH